MGFKREWQWTYMLNLPCSTRILLFLSKVKRLWRLNNEVRTKNWPFKIFIYAHSSHHRGQFPHSVLHILEPGPPSVSLQCLLPFLLGVQNKSKKSLASNDFTQHMLCLHYTVIQGRAETAREKSWIADRKWGHFFMVKILFYSNFLFEI